MTDVIFLAIFMLFVFIGACVVFGIGWAFLLVGSLGLLYMSLRLFFPTK